MPGNGESLERLAIEHLRLTRQASLKDKST